MQQHTHKHKYLWLELSGTYCRLKVQVPKLLYGLYIYGGVYFVLFPELRSVFERLLGPFQYIRVFKRRSMGAWCVTQGLMSSISAKSGRLTVDSEWIKCFSLSSDFGPGAWLQDPIQGSQVQHPDAGQPAKKLRRAGADRRVPAIPNSPGSSR